MACMQSVTSSTTLECMEVRLPERPESHSPASPFERPTAAHGRSADGKKKGFYFTLVCH